MITGKDFYNVMAAVVPLYVAMILAYGSVRWWKLLSPDQCSGINRFVALFAVPLLSFQIIANNNPYEMNVLFVAADGVQKLVFIAILGIWVWYSKRGSLDWFITFFMVATLPNTLVMGVPLLYAMYGPVHGNLVVQAVVLQCIVWYTLLLFLYEYRSARILIMDQFPDTAASIVSFKVDHDVISLDGRDPVMTEAQIGEDGKLHVKVRKSTASAHDMLSLKSPIGSVMGTPRPSNLSNAEIYSLQSSRNMTPRDSSFNRNDYYLMMANKGNSSPIHQPGRLSESSYGLQSGLQSSSSREDIHPAPPRISYSRSQQRNYGDISHMHKEVPQAPASPNSKTKPGGRFDTDAKELHMFVWSSSASPTSERGLHCFGGNDYGVHDSATKEPKLVVLSPTEEVAMEVSSEGRNQVYEDHMDHDDFTFGTKQPEKLEKNESGSTAALTPRLPGKGRELPPASVMTKLILDMVWRKLIRNPNTYSSLLGLTWALISFRWHVSMPKIIEKSITILSDAGLGMAMFSLGLFMALQSRLLACGTKMAIIGMVVRFCAGPAVMSAASAVTGLRSLDLRAAIVQAALPQGIVPFVFAKEYNVHPDILSTAVIFGMLVALPITLLYYILLGI